MINESRLVQTFLDLVAIDSPSGQEQAIADDLVKRFTALGGEVVRDERHNLIARFPNGSGDWLMLSAHMDTVGTDVGIKPQIRDGIIFSDGTTILGGDDKSGVAVILEVIRSLQEEGVAHPPLEAVISVSEETGLQGARWLDKSQIRSRSGIILDGGGPLSNIVVSAPSQDTLRVTVYGRKAHAGAEPEKGINTIRVASEAIAAMPLGRIDEETTANIGVIQGGTATNIVPDEVFIRGEARSRNDEKLAKQTAGDGRGLRGRRERNGARVEVKIQRSYNSYALTEATPIVAKAMAAIRAARADARPESQWRRHRWQHLRRARHLLLRHQHGHEPGAYDQREYRDLRHDGRRAVVAGYCCDWLKITGWKFKVKG